jgi:RNA polymerase sigma factor (TIGR02999 family)
MTERNLEQLFRRAQEADPAAAEQLFALLYDELHRLAAHHLQRGNSALTLGTTTLVHEAYLNMVGRADVAFPDRQRFFAYASRAMRGLVIDFARRRCAKKRGRMLEITLEEGGVGSPEVKEAAQDLPALNDGLNRLGELDPKLAELVDLHFFGGFSFAEIATMRGISERTVEREWRKARTLLHRLVRESGGQTMI